MRAGEKDTGSCRPAPPAYSISPTHTVAAANLYWDCGYGKELGKSTHLGVYDWILIY